MEATLILRRLKLQQLAPSADWGKPSLRLRAVTKDLRLAAKIIVSQFFFLCYDSMHEALKQTPSQRPKPVGRRDRAPFHRRARTASVPVRSIKVPVQDWAHGWVERRKGTRIKAVSREAKGNRTNGGEQKMAQTKVIPGLTGF